MWKAIVWGFAGLLLGIVLAGPMGAALGAIVGTVIGSVAGALPFHRSAAVCEPKACRAPSSGSSAVSTIGALAVAAVAVYALWQVAVVLAAAAALAFAVVAGLAWSTRLLRDRLSVVHWPSMQAPVQRAAPVQAELQRARAALSAPPRAIGAPVIHAVITDAKHAKIRSAR